MVFVSGGERVRASNETTPAASSLSSVCDVPFAVAPRRTFHQVKVRDCQGQGLLIKCFLGLQCAAIVRRNALFWECFALPCSAASGMLLLETKTMSAE